MKDDYREFQKLLIRELKVSDGRSLKAIAEEQEVPTSDAREIATKVFRSLCRRAVEDHVVTTSERRFLRKVARQLGLSDRAWKGMLKQCSIEVVREAKTESLSDGVITTDEAYEIDELRHALGLPMHGVQEEQPKRSKQSKLERRLELISGRSRIWSYVLLSALIFLLFSAIAAAVIQPSFSPTLIAICFGVAAAGITIPGFNVMSLEKERSALLKKQSMRTTVVHVVDRNRHENVAYSQRKVDEEGNCYDSGFCASTFDYQTDLEKRGTIKVSRKLYFQLEPGQYYLVRASTTDGFEIHKVVRVASQADFYCEHG